MPPYADFPGSAVKSIGFASPLIAAGAVRQTKPPCHRFVIFAEYDEIMADGVRRSSRKTDVLIVGSGIVGLAHALAAVRRGYSVRVVDRDAQANGASVRNFGFVTVTGQQAGDTWRRARRSREVWEEISPKAGIKVAHKGLVVAARRPEAEAVLQVFVQTETGAGCRLLTVAEARDQVPALRAEGLRMALWSPHELRVESRDAIPRLAAWLQEAHGVDIVRGVQVLAVDVPAIDTTQGRFDADTVIVCPGDDYLSLYAERIAAHGLTRCSLQMMRVVPPAPMRLGAAVMSDFGLVRYLGYSQLEPAAALRLAIERDEPEMLEHGIHLIAVQSPLDDSLVVGDSHHYAATPPPFGREDVDELILREFDRVLEVPGRRVVQRWIGTYASAADRTMLIDRPAERVRIVLVTSGTGASTAFGIAEDVFAELS
jgi:FAD dependent oxidoreductase TIGR03364